MKTQQRANKAINVIDKLRKKGMTYAQIAQQFNDETGLTFYTAEVHRAMVDKRVSNKLLDHLAPRYHQPRPAKRRDVPLTEHQAAAWDAFRKAKGMTGEQLGRWIIHTMAMHKEMRATHVAMAALLTSEITEGLAVAVGSSDRLTLRGHMIDEYGEDWRSLQDELANTIQSWQMARQHETNHVDES